MSMLRPADGQTVWIEYPEGKHFEARYDAAGDCFLTAAGAPIARTAVSNWSQDEHEDTDIADTLNRGEKGRLARD